MKRFAIIFALLSLPFIAGCMHHGHYYNDHRPYASDGYYGPIGMTILHIRNILAQNLSRECRTAATIGTKPKKYLRALLEQSVSRASVEKAKTGDPIFAFGFYKTPRDVSRRPSLKIT